MLLGEQRTRLLDFLHQEKKHPRTSQLARHKDKISGNMGMHEVFPVHVMSCTFDSYGFDV